jgi:hypothetical protein
MSTPTPQTIIANYSASRLSQAKALASLNSQLRSAKRTLDASVASNSSPSVIATQQALVDSLQSQITSGVSTLKALNAGRKVAVAQVTSASGVSLVTATASASPQLYTGSTGPRGPTGPSVSIVVDAAPAAGALGHAVTSGGFYTALSSASSSQGITVGTFFPTSASTGQLWTDGTALYMYTSAGTWFHTNAAS